MSPGLVRGVLWGLAFELAFGIALTALIVWIR